MIKILKKVFRFLVLGAIIFLVSYYFMGKNDQILLTMGLLFLGGSFISKIIELSLIKKKI